MGRVSVLEFQAKTHYNLVNGDFIPATGGEIIEIYSPVDSSLVGAVPAMTREDIDEAARGCKQAQGPWQRMPVYKRADLLYRAADLLEQQAEELAAVLTMEIAKDKKSSLSEVIRSADLLRYTADVSKNSRGEAVFGDNFPGGSRNKMSFVARVPMGTVLAVSPFNYPVNLSVSKIAPALMGGNTVLLKPATQGAASALMLAKILDKAGLPKGVLNTITGKGSVIGDYAVTHRDVDFINFTGSTQVGEHISQICAMKPMILELGGKDAAIVLEDADLNFAADNIVEGAYSYSGQRCTAVKRILVVEPVADQLIEKLKTRIGRLRWGDPREEGVAITPLINKEAADAAQRLIDDALEKGATLIVGNEREGNLLTPTLIDHVDTDMDLAWIEPFAPVLPILRVKNAAQAVEIANRSEYGLQSSVFTNDINRAFAIASRLEVGTVQINNKTERGPDNFPFLGVKNSGMGTQGVKYSIEAMTRPKAVTINLRGGSFS